MKKLIYQMTLLLLLVTIGFSSPAQVCQKPKNLDVKFHNFMWYDTQLKWDAPDPDTIPITSTDILELYNNGGFITSYGNGCQGVDVSSPTNAAYTILAWNMNLKTKQYALDDFTLTAKVAAKYIEFYCIPVGGKLAHVPEDPYMLGGSVAIYDVNPKDNPDAQPIYGRINQLSDTTIGMVKKIEYAGANVTRMFDYSQCKNPIFKVTMDLDIVLPAGRYWVAYTMTGKYGSVPMVIATRNPMGGSTGDAYCRNSAVGLLHLTSDDGKEQYGIPFSLFGFYQQNAVKGYEISRNGEVIYNKNSLVTTFYEKLDTTTSATDYTYAVKALWIKDSCKSEAVAKTVTMDPDPCPAPIPFYEVSQDFESTNFPELDKCWRVWSIGDAKLRQKYNGELNAMKPKADAHGGNAMLMYGSGSILVQSRDTGYLTSPKFTFEGKKVIVSFWMYRDNQWIVNKDHVAVYCHPAGAAIDYDSPNIVVYRSTDLTPKLPVFNTGWYHFSFPVDGTMLRDTAYQLTFSLTTTDGGGNDMYIDDIKIAEAGQPDGDCQMPTTPKIVYKDNEAQLEWGAPGAFPDNEGEITYFTRNIFPAAAIGRPNANYSMKIASRWDVEDLKNLGLGAGSTITSISFVPALRGASVDNFKLIILQGGRVDNARTDNGERVIYPGREVYSQEFSKNAIETREWNTIPLEIPVEIDPTKELWFGVQCDVKSTAQSGPFISDEGPHAFAKGNLMWGSDEDTWSFATDWDRNYLYNWCLKAGVSVPYTTFSIPSDPSVTVEKYVVYRDGAQLAEVQGLSYTDNTVQSGKEDYQYAVSAHYNTGCFSPKAEATIYNPPTTSVEAGDKNVGQVFSVYPNPVNNLLNIEGRNIRKVEIYNHIGQLMGISTTNSSQINTSSYKDGLYLVKITDISGYTETRQIVIIH